MNFQLYFSNAGVPVTGLTPVWLSLIDAVTSLTFPSPPTVTEVGGGWYKFSLTPVNPLVGVIDGGVTLTGADRYKPIQIPTSQASAFGSVQVTLQVSDPLHSTAIPDVEMVIFNQDNTLLVNSALTNSMGQTVAQLNPGQYNLTLRKDGYNFATPVTFTVTGPGPQSFSYSGTQVGDVAADFRFIVVPFNPGINQVE